jgi:CheY-like chemotaxis protein
MLHQPPLILIIDDEKDFLDIFSTKLKNSGFAVETSLGGEAVLEKIQAIQPDLVLLDVNMPDVDGIEILSRIKSNQAINATKVVFLTNYGEPLKIDVADEKFAREIGALDYIRKSDDLNTILRDIKKILEIE